MSTSLLDDPFKHHVWATLRLIDACRSLPPESLGTTVPGTFGSILDTMRHLVGADASYLHVLAGTPEVDSDSLDLIGLRAVMEDDRDAWTAFLAGDIDPDEVATRHRDDGSESRAPVGIRLAQALHHGTDHRSQVCTALTALGVEPPAIDAWDFAEQEGRLAVVPSPA
jgi:uncharacterized damage-inducible protein DinB